MESLDILKIAVKAADSKKGREIRVIKIRDISVLADYFVFDSGDSNTQTKAIADEIEFKLTEAADIIGYELNEDAHSSLHDALATLAIENFIKSYQPPEEGEAVY